MQLSLRRLLTPPPADPNLPGAGPLSLVTICLYFIGGGLLASVIGPPGKTDVLAAVYFQAGVMFFVCAPLLFFIGRVPQGYTAIGIAPRRLTGGVLAGGVLIWIGTGLAIWFPLLQAYFAGLKLLGFSRPPQPVFAKVAEEVGGGSPNLVLILLVVMILPFFEELIFRGLLLSLCRQYMPRSLAVLVTAALFGMMHIDPWIAVFPVFLLGILFGYARERTGSIWGAWAAHVIHNGVTVIFSPIIIRLYDAA